MAQDRWEKIDSMMRNYGIERLSKSKLSVEERAALLEKAGHGEAAKALRKGKERKVFDQLPLSF